MKIQFYYPRWGSENIDWEIFCQKVKQAGYAGVEAPVPEESKERIVMMDALKRNDLKLIANEIFYLATNQKIKKKVETFLKTLNFSAYDFKEV